MMPLWRKLIHRNIGVRSKDRDWWIPYELLKQVFETGDKADMAYVEWVDRAP